jgi:hypothetical protein
MRLAGDRLLVLEDANVGLDYATVHLGGLYRQQLEVGGVTAIAKNAWSDHLVEHDQWALVGIPSETVSYDGRTTLTAKFVMAPLLPADAPSLAGQKSQNRFYARLADGSEQLMKDVDGMSGGPVFMLKCVDNIWKYNVIGVQSAWYRDSRILAICPFAAFGYELESIVEKALSEPGSNRT